MQPKEFCLRFFSNMQVSYLIWINGFKFRYHASFRLEAVAIWRSLFLRHFFLFFENFFLHSSIEICCSMFADTILKKYSSTVATIFTGIASAVLFGHTLTMNFVLGISIIFISMHQVTIAWFFFLIHVKINFQFKTYKLGELSFYS